MSIDSDSIPGCISEAVSSILRNSSDANSRERIYRKLGVQNNGEFAQKIEAKVAQLLGNLEGTGEAKNDTRSILVIREELDKAAKILETPLTPLKPATKSCTKSIAFSSDEEEFDPQKTPWAMSIAFSSDNEEFDSQKSVTTSLAKSIAFTSDEEELDPQANAKTLLAKSIAFSSDED
ncbi:hypothetical protein L596_028443 [Steinernema carpocapsae]|uniref:Uncharacterized protein n=1 Tax=Steinernema carpocapsae TaxID=34508 RepID=A0A4U5LYK3_STECR|nr:hypothetical protein L596_028443 [Steinernema carpocapsae]